MKKYFFLFIVCLYMALGWIVIENKNDDFSIIFCFEESEDVSVHIYADEGDGYSEQNSILGSSKDKLCIVSLEQFDFEKIQQLRFDIIGNTNNKIYLKEIQIVNGKKIIQKINANQFDANISMYAGIIEKQIVQDKLELLLSSDTQIIISKNLISEMKRNIGLYYLTVFLLVVILSIVFLVLCVFIYNRCKKSSFVRKIFYQATINKFIVFELLLILLTVFLYSSYLSGQKYFLFKDIAADSYNENYPYLVYLSNLLKSHKGVIGWNWWDGLGSPINYKFINIFNFFILLGSENIPYFLGFSQVIKIIAAGNIFYLYLKTMGRNRYSCMIGGLGYAFCAHMIVRQSWVYYPNEVVVAALWLWSFEMYFKKRNRIWLPIATTFLFFSLPGYHVILYSCFAVVYSIFRILWESIYVKDGKKIVGFTVGSIAIGLLCSAFLTIPDILAGLSSDRLQESGKLFDFSLFFQIDSLQNLGITFFRTLGNDLMGVLEYNGNANLLEDPCFFIGLLNLMLLSQLWSVLNKRKRIIAFICIGISIIYIIFPQVALLLSAFTGKYKLSSFWILILMLFFSTECLDYVSQGFFSFKSYWITFIGICLLSIIFGLILDQRINYQHLFINLFFVLVYGIFLHFGIRKNAILILTLLTFLFVTEIYINSYEITNKRITVNKEELMDSGYQDDTIKALIYLKEYDPDNFWRIDKKYNSVFFQDSIIQEYMSTKSYSGGVGNSYIKKFANFFKFPQGEGDRCFFGTGESTEISTLLGIKYIFTQNESINNWGYKFIKRIGNINIYQNEYPLNIISFYDSIDSIDVLQKMSIQEKRASLLNTCYVEGKSEFLSKKIEKNISTFIPHKFIFEENELGGDIYFNELTEKDIILLTFDIQKKLFYHKYGVINAYDNSGKLLYSTEIRVDDDKTNYEHILNGAHVVHLRLIVPDLELIENLDIKKIDGNKYYRQYIKNVNQLQQNNFILKNISNTKLVGEFVSEKDGILVMSTMYSKAWSCKIDGKQTDVFPVNVGLCGVKIQEGEHSVEFIYKIPYNDIYTIFSLIGLLLQLINIASYKYQLKAK